MAIFKKSITINAEPVELVSQNDVYEVYTGMSRKVIYIVVGDIVYGSIGGQYNDSNEVILDYIDE